ncbi:MAG: peptidase, partial [Desulfuromonadales bacterium]|nr:peptidase [Desulfuromonadales bacterium]
LFLAFGIAGCTVYDDESDGALTCSNDGQKQFVLEALYDWYLWNDLLPDDVRRKDYDSPEALLAYLTTFSP